MTLRYLTAGESHGPALVGILEGLPADVPIQLAQIERHLERRRAGHGRSPRMSFEEARNVLERASARETATRVALAALARMLLTELGISVLSHVTRIGEVAIGDDVALPGPEDLDRIDADPVRCLDAGASRRMQERIDRAKQERDTLGGVVEVLVHGLPPGPV